jgi:SAM-dependent methyltransferase
MNNSTLEPVKDPWDNILHVEYKIKPPYSHKDYLHLVDLNEFLKSQGSNAALTILDYGAGASPYRQYFPNADYRRADITGAASLQYKIDQDSTIPESDETFDVILSTQVAEHVPNPGVYFQEAFRLLKKGGRLILTTHGMWEEHGSPYDFQRWTGDGLRRDVARAGFKQITVYKLTCGLRCGFQMFTRGLFDASVPDHPLGRVLFKTFRWIYSKLFPLIYRLCDRGWAQDRLFKIEGNNRGSAWYIVIAIIAEK